MYLTEIVSLGLSRF